MTDEPLRAQDLDEKEQLLEGSDLPCRPYSVEAKACSGLTYSENSHGTRANKRMRRKLLA